MIKAGDIIYLNFTPASGHEQRGRRPALVISNSEFNKRVNLLGVCPITSTIRKFPLHIQLDGRTSIQGEIMCEQLTIVDHNAREASFIERAPDDIVDKVRNIVQSIFDK